MTDDERHEKLCQFQVEFAELVRKFVPVFPLDNTNQKRVFDSVGHTKTIVDPQQALLLVQMQDSTSVYNPFVWSK